jgi:HemY protein
MQSLSAIASGDADTAEKFSKKARKKQHADHGMTDFLDGVSARMKGDLTKAKKHFSSLSKEEHAASLGLRGLMQIGLDEGQMDRATIMAERAYKMHPKQRWIIKTLYKLHIQNRQWQKAEDLLPKLHKFAGVSKGEVLRDHVAILIARAEELKERGDFEESMALKVKANKLDKTSLPAVLALLPIYLKKNEKRKAVKLIEQVWPTHQHPELLDVWGQLMPNRYKKDTAKYMSWYERLLALKPDSDEGQLAAAEAAMHENMYGQAAAYLKQAEGLRKSKKLYRLYARLEELQDGDVVKVKEYLNKAVDAADNKSWVCCETGLTYDAWSLFAKPHNSFNTIIWDYPENCQALAARAHVQFTPVLLEQEQHKAA